MWQLIKENRRRTSILIGLMAVVLMTLGAAVGYVVEPLHGWKWGLAGAAGLWVTQVLAVWFGGDALMLASSGAVSVGKEDAPQLINIVEEMAIAAGLGQRPQVFIIENDVPNAFAVGMRRDRAAVAVTSGLLRRLNRDELQGVVAHEIAHIINEDVRFLTAAAVMVGSIVLISDLFFRGLLLRGHHHKRLDMRGAPQLQLLLVVAAVALAVLAPIAARLLYFACSRGREYLADATSARLTRYPDGLASALEKISRSAADMRMEVNRAVAPMYIVNPVQAAAHGWGATHPPTPKRIEILRNMAGGAGFRSYEKAAWRALGKSGQFLVGLGAMDEGAQFDVRAPLVDESGGTVAAEAMAFIDRRASFISIPCACGVRIKLTESDLRPTVVCPKCGTNHIVPHATDFQLADSSGDIAKSGDEPVVEPPAEPLLPNQEYCRREAGWESFRCRCGHTLQLSPAFAGSTIDCGKCRSTVLINNPTN